MRISLMVLMMTAFLTGGASASPKKMTEKAIMHQRQKQEMKALKLKEKYEKQMVKNQDLPKAVRAQMKHHMEREQRRLRNRQKDQRQELKDRQRILREGYKQLGSG